MSSRLTHVCPRARSAAPAGKKEMRFACSNCTNVCKAVVGTMSISVRLSLAVALCCLAPLKMTPYPCPISAHTARRSTSALRAGHVPPCLAASDTVIE